VHRVRKCPAYNEGSIRQGCVANAVRYSLHQDGIPFGKRSAICVRGGEGEGEGEVSRSKQADYRQVGLADCRAASTCLPAAWPLAVQFSDWPANGIASQCCGLLRMACQLWMIAYVRQALHSQQWTDRCRAEARLHPVHSSNTLSHILIGG